MQEIIRSIKYVSQLNFSSINPVIALATSEPPKYPKSPVKPAAVPAAFLGANSKAWSPISITGP